MEKQIYSKNGYLLIKPLDESETMAGNIILPDMGQEKPAIGTVIVSSSWFNQFTGEWVSSTYSPNDIVIIPRMGSQKIKYNNEEYWLCKELEVLATLN